MAQHIDVTNFKRLMKSLGKQNVKRTEVLVGHTHTASILTKTHDEPSAINALLDAANMLQGINHGKMVAYFKACTPFVFKKGVGFTKKKKDVAEQMYADLDTFMAEHVWYDFDAGKSGNSTYKLNPEALTASIQKKVTKAQDDHTLTLEQLQELKTALNDMVTAEINGFNKVDTGDIQPETVVQSQAA